MQHNKEYLEYLLEKGFVDIGKLVLIESHSDEGARIAKTLGVRLNGWWKELHKWLFTDDAVTKSSFAAKSMEEAKEKLEKMREAFKHTRPVMA
jgi:hypothetical protein